MDEDRLTIYKSRALLRSGWRWRYQAAGNNSKLANGGEAYNSVSDAIESAFRVVGINYGLLGDARDVEGVYERAGRSTVRVVVES